MATAVGTLRALFELDDKFSAQMAKVEKSLGAAGKKWDSVGKSFSNIGSRLTVGVTLPLVAVGAATVKAASDFESSFAGVRKTVDATEAQFAEMEAGFRSLSQEIPISVNELNRIGEAAGQLGIPREHVLDFTRTMADLSVTTNLTSEEAANAIARIQNSFGAAGKETSNLASTIVALGNAGASTEAELVQFGLRLAGAGKVAGLTQANVLAIGNAMASIGVEAEAGGTAVSKMLISMATAVNDGNEDLAVFAQVAGMTAQEFSTAFEKDAAGAFTMFVEGMGRQGLDATKTLQALGLEDQRLIQSFLKLGGAGDLLAESIRVGNKAWKENTALSIEAQKRYQTFESQLQLLWNRVNDVAITLGQALLPVLKNLIDAADPLINGLAAMARWFAELPKPVQLTVLGMLAFTAALGPAIWAVGSFIGAAGTIVTAMSGITASIATGTGVWATIAGVVVKFGTALVGLATGPVGIAIAAAAALALAWYVFGDDIMAALQPVISWLDNTFGAAFEGLKVLIGEQLSLAAEDVRKFVEEINGYWQKIAKTTKQWWGLAADDVKRFIDEMRGYWQSYVAWTQSLNIPKQMAPKAPQTNFQPGDSAVIDKWNDRLFGWWGTLKKVGEESRNLTAAQGTLVGALGQTATGAVKLDAVTTGLSAAVTTAGKASDKTGAQTRSLAADLKAAQAAMAKLTVAQKADIEAGKKLGATAKEIAEKIGTTESVVELYADRLKKMEGATKKAEEATEKLKEEIAALTGGPSIEAANRLATAMASVADFKQFDPSKVEEMRETLVNGALALERMGKDSSVVMEQLGRLPPITATIYENLTKTSDAVKEMPVPFGKVKDLVAATPGPLGKSYEETKRWGDQLQKLPSPLETIKKKEEEARDAAITWGDGLDALGGAFANLAQVADGDLGKIAKSIGTVITAMDAAQKAGAVAGGGFAAAFSGGLKGGFPAIAGAMSQMAAGLVGGFGAIMSATDTGSLATDIIGGAMAGAQTGAAIGTAIGAIAASTAKGAAVAGLWGAAAGAIVGVFIAVFRDRDTANLMKSVGEQWGVQISEGLGEKIKQTKDIVGSEGAATLIHMAQILEEAGGLTADTFAPMLEKLRGVFSEIDMGGLTTAQAMKILDENFGTFAQHVLDSGQLASAAFVEIMTLNARFGTESKAISDFIQSEAGKVAGGLTQMLNIAQTQKDVENLGTIVIGTFNAAIKGGEDWVEAINALGPALNQVIETNKRLGITANNAALQELVNYQRRVNANETLVRATQALNETFLAMSNIGALNEKTLKAMENQGLSTFKQLRGAGFSQNEALQMMKGFLENVIAAHERLGTPIDKATQKLINQADKLGILKGNAKSFEETFETGINNLTTAVNTLTKTLGGVPPEVDKITSAIGRVPKDVKVGVDIQATKRGFKIGGQEIRIQGFQGGSGGLVDFDPRGEMVVVHGREAIVTEPQWDAMAGVMRRVTEDVSGGDGLATLARAVARASKSRGGGQIVVRNEIGGQRVSEFVINTTQEGLRSGKLKVPRSSQVERVY